MKKIIVKAGFLAVFVFLLVHSLSPEQNRLPLEKPVQPGLNKRPASWTVLIYLNGDNDLESAAIDDFLKIAAAGSSQPVNIVAQFDRIEGYDNRFGDWSGTKRFYISKGIIPTTENAILNMGEVNMADPAELLDFCYWGTTRYPAAHYALLFWDHGSGRLKSKAELWMDWKQRKEADLIFKDLCRDDSSGGASLSMEEVKKILNSCGGMSLIGFAGSMLGMVEAAYELKDLGEVMVAHGEIEPLGGWPFDVIFSDLTAHPSWTARQWGAAIVERYATVYGAGANQSAIDLTGMDLLIDKISILAKKMIVSRDNGQKAVNDAAAQVIAGIKQIVSGKNHNLPIYFPATAEHFNPVYINGNIKFPGDSHWEDFLQAFYHSLAGSRIAETRAAAKQPYHPAYVDLTGFCELFTRSQGDYYTESLIGHDFFGEGTAQDFKEDDDYITHALPFDFPFFGDIIPEDSTIYIGSNGYIDFDSQGNHSDYSNSTAELAGNKRIAPCWADLKTSGSAQQGEDVYITENPGCLVIRWAAETYGDEEPVNFEVALFADGYIQFNYGAGNGDISPWDTAPTIGISKGDSSSYYLSEYNGETWLTNVNSDLFKHKHSITVNSPNGEEEWAVGSAQYITWNTVGRVNDVFISYSTDSGETWQMIEESTDNDGHYRWIVPNDRSEYCKVRVGENGPDDGPVDDSDQVFAIVSAETPAVTVISPNGGEQLVVDTECLIKWANSGEVGNIKIDYSTSGGEAWTNIVQSIDNTGSYNWTVPDNTSDICRIRVSESDGSPGDISDDVFSIVPPASITVTSPNGNEEWNAGSIQNITWNSSESVGDVRIDYSTTGGETWNNIVLSTDNTGSYAWTVPDTPANNCKVRVSRSDSETGPADASDGTFTIAAAQAIIVTSPNGGEMLEVESSFTVTWENCGQVGNVKIDYSLNDGESWTNIVQSIDNNGRYIWTVPNNTSNDCKIKVSESDGNPFDISDAVFKIISTPTITVTSPNGNETWSAGSSHNITWTSTGVIGSVSIEYSGNGGNSYTTIVASTPNSGSYNWIVPNTPSSSCLVRINGYDADGSPVDVSNSTFTITNN